eukprot:7376911-Prymnesium_polylepis.2
MYRPSSLKTVAHGQRLVETFVLLRSMMGVEKASQRASFPCSRAQAFVRAAQGPAAAPPATPTRCAQDTTYD